jgi:hypothetical protein
MARRDGGDGSPALCCRLLFDPGQRDLVGSKRILIAAAG